MERAAYEADRAARQFQAVEPENRLVARTLEAGWEEKLRAQRELLEPHERFLRDQPRRLTSEDQTRIEQLARDVPALWSAETTSDSDRKEILREIIDHVVVDIEGETKWVEARIHWAGGHQTYTRFRRPLRASSHLSNAESLIGKVRELLEEGLSAGNVAQRLRAEGYRTARGNFFSENRVRSIMRRFGFQSSRAIVKQDPGPLGEDEWFISDLMRTLQIGTGKIYSRIESGELPARRALDGRWVVRVDEAMRKELVTPRKATPPHTNRKPISPPDQPRQAET
ncbi:hypothetical protein [Planctomyces sp. SH-PL14]|uniref:hypothetical protein n=1 Tax=Planctomyces sp. SH-PL14 TaxID=1632864 RepID=UPI00078D52EA|nr:hypothetical protein [Planctomyces sp. SH-PL14]AMV16411.1 hypothetical protein VT03_00885 [Planctomyces sp. SH-PL14]